ncbi:MAG: hypothetical protein KGO82_02905 [Bacteroidota bacterium]|nr:hypothetical protein [Bacteroidota bacterium]
MDTQALITILNKELDTSWPGTQSFEAMREQLVAQIDYLINKDFQRLLSILYRVDVDEAKLRALLQSNPERPAAETIADSIIERQLQKLQSRKQFGKKPADPETDEGAERW